MAAKCNGAFQDEDERKKYLEETLAKFKADEIVYKAIAEGGALDPVQLRADNEKKQEELAKLKIEVEKVTVEEEAKRKEVEALQKQIEDTKKRNEEEVLNNPQV